MSHSESTQTHELLASVAAGSQSALNQLIRVHAAYLRRIVQLRISPELKARIDESDVVQETQLVIIRRIEEFLRKRPASFRIWLRSRAIEQLADQHRRHVTAEKRSVRREKNFDDASSMAIARTLLSESPSKMLQKKELAEQVRDLIETLNEFDREILMLRHAEGLTNSEVAEALNIEPMTARKRYGRALRRLVDKATSAGLEEYLYWNETT